MEFWQFAADLLFYGIAALLAIFVWGRTREIAWLSMVVGVIAMYAASILEAIHLLGAVNLDPFLIYGASPIRIFVNILPALFFAFGFAGFLRSRLR
ncbi:MAG: hypothetical protein D6B26_06455 [Spirochaetaceae bacterium]|nr:MAG: hypothetical protein D6B26_06455 [Spirochaetaceae bacterium]